MVFAEFHGGRFEPVTYELVGKGRELADNSGQKVTCVAVGCGIRDAARRLLSYPVDRVLVYDSRDFNHFVSGAYASALEDAILLERPSVVLVGATPLGRSLAPRVAIRFRTGLTADCTGLDIRPTGELVQTRPAFGGNVMATILTRDARPQMATVRPRVMPKAQTAAGGYGVILDKQVAAPSALASLARYLGAVRVRSETPLPRAESIAEAEVIVACGRGVRAQKDLRMFDLLAQRLGGVLAGSRPLIEKGWLPSSRQVGQSGRTVRPDVYLACGISGAIQHVAGMSASGTVIAVNSDRDAPIFETANYGLVGDIYEIVPGLLKALGGVEDGW
jgi:electron transfer flavoprotein alpha subunit